MRPSKVHHVRLECLVSCKSSSPASHLAVNDGVLAKHDHLARRRHHKGRHHRARHLPPDAARAVGCAVDARVATVVAGIFSFRIITEAIVAVHFALFSKRFCERLCRTLGTEGPGRSLHKIQPVCLSIGPVFDRNTKALAGAGNTNAVIIKFALLTERIVKSKCSRSGTVTKKRQNECSLLRW